MDECQRRKNRNIDNNTNADGGGGGGSLDRKNKKRFSVTSTSSSMSMLASSFRDEEHNLCPNGDLNNNNSNNYYTRVTESGRESFGSASSFTKDIMRMIGEQQQSGSNAENGEEEERRDRRPSEVILRMNRRNSDMSEKAKFSHIICDCPCHEEEEVEEAFGGKKGHYRTSLTSPNSVNIYSIEEPTSKKKKKMKRGQLENRSYNDEADDDDWDNDSECERRCRRAAGEEYDNDEVAYEDEVVDRRRSVL